MDRSEKEDEAINAQVNKGGQARDMVEEFMFVDFDDALEDDDG